MEETSLSPEATPLLLKDDGGLGKDSLVDDEFHFSDGAQTTGPRSSVCAAIFNLTNTSKCRRGPPGHGPARGPMCVLPGHGTA